MAGRTERIRLFIQDFRFGPLSRASYASPALDNNESAIRVGPNEFDGVSSTGFRCLTNLAGCGAIIFSDTAPTHFPQPPKFATAIAVLPAGHRQRPDSPEHLAKQPRVQVSLDLQHPVVA